MATATAAQKERRRFRGLHARDLIIALSFANLCYFRVWYELESFDMTRFPAMKALPTRMALLSAMGNVLILAVSLTLLAWLFRRLPARTTDKGRTVFLLLLSVPLTGIYRVVSERHQMMRGELIRQIGPVATALLYIGGAVLFAIVVWRWHANLARAAAVLLLMFTPGVLLTFGQAVKGLYADPSVLANLPSPPPSAAARKTPRVIWLLFDEWDYRLSFPERKADLALPEMDRLTQTSLAATNALPPARATSLSIPMLLTGERYVADRLEGPSKLTVNPIDEPDRYYDWSTRESIFSAVHAMNFNTAVVGWYLPYCRLIPNQLNSCEWLPLENQRNSVRTSSMWLAMADQTRSLFETSLFSPFGQSLTTQRHMRTYQELSRRAVELMTDPTYGVVFVHMAIPHTPFIYERRTRTFSAKNSAVQGYYDALALLDLTIGEFRKQLEASGQWDSSTILFTSDHYYRSAPILDGKMDSRVPFLLKLAGQNRGLPYAPRFNALVTKQLLLAVLRQEIRTPEEAAHWLERHGTEAPPVGAPTVE